MTGLNRVGIGSPGFVATSATNVAPGSVLMGSMGRIAAAIGTATSYVLSTQVAAASYQPDEAPVIGEGPSAPGIGLGLGIAATAGGAVAGFFGVRRSRAVIGQGLAGTLFGLNAINSAKTNMSGDWPLVCGIIGVACALGAWATLIKAWVAEREANLRYMLRSGERDYADNSNEWRDDSESEDRLDGQDTRNQQPDAAHAKRDDDIA